jgi:hypothetical protein
MGNPQPPGAGDKQNEMPPHLVLLSPFSGPTAPDSGPLGNVGLAVRWTSVPDVCSRRSSRRGDDVHPIDSSLVEASAAARTHSCGREPSPPAVIL